MDRMTLTQAAGLLAALLIAASCANGGSTLTPTPGTTAIASVPVAPSTGPGRETPQGQTAEPSPTPRPEVGTAWFEVVDPDLTSGEDQGSMYGVVAGGPGAIAWGYRYGPATEADGLPVPRGPEIWTTADGRDWVPATVETPPDAHPSGPGEVLDVAPGGPGFLAIGSYFRVDYGLAVLVWTSDDGRTWERIPDQPTFDHVVIDRIIAWRGTLVAFGCHLETPVDCGPAGVWASADGIAWSEGALVLPERWEGPGLVAAGSDRLWGVGRVAADMPVPYSPVAPTRITSTDGLTWEAAVLPVVGVERFHPLADVAFVTVEEIPSGDSDFEQPAAWVSRTPGVYRSDDLETWGEAAPGTNGAREVVQVGDTLIMLGTSGTGCWHAGVCVAAAWRSVDAGLTWAPVPVSASSTAAGPGSSITAATALADGTLVGVGALAALDGDSGTGSWVSPPEVTD